ncbi:MAG: tetratricopeptide repeat protein, partial [Planctomycetota bacterium]
GEVYVMDWGIAKQISAPTLPLDNRSEAFFSSLWDTKNSQSPRTIGGLGTIGYMPPEQQENATQVTAQSDVYALGKILRECFTFRSPWEEFQAQVQQDSVRLKQPSKKIESKNQYVPKEIQAIVDKATAIERSERYPSVFHLAEDIQRYLKNLPVSAKEYTFREIFFNYCQRYRPFLTFLIYTFIFIFSFWLYQKKLEQMKQLQQQEENHLLLEQAFNLAQHQIRLGQNSSVPGRESRSQKIQHHLQALIFLNQALSLSTPVSTISTAHLEEEKLHIGTVLLPLCYEEEDYSMANFVVDDLQTLSESTLSDLEKKALQDEIQDKKTMVLMQHRKTLQEWEHYFKSLARPGNPEEIQEFIYEINTMQEREIFEKLRELLEEGTLSLQKNSSERRHELTPFYCSIVELLGRSEHREAGTFLKKSLYSVYNKSQQYQKADLGQIEYFSEILIALWHLKDEDLYQSFHDLRSSGIFPGSLFRMKIQFVYQKILAQIIEFYSNKIEMNPDDSLSYGMRGASYFDQKKFQESIQDISNALQNRSLPLEKTCLAYSMRGRAKFEIHDLEGAKNDFMQVIQFAPQNPEFGDVYAYLAKIKWTQKDYDGALSDSYQALQLDSQNLEVCSQLANFLMQQEKWDKAILYYTQTLQINSNLPQIYYLRGICKIAEGDYDGAIADFSEAISLHPQYIEAYLVRASAKLSKEDFEGAIADCSEILQINPQFDQAYFGRGSAKSKKGDDEGAIADYEKTLSLKPADPLLNSCVEALQQYVIPKYRAKDYSGALDILQKLMQHLPPDHPNQKKYQQQMQQIQSLQRR